MKVRLNYNSYYFRNKKLPRGKAIWTFQLGFKKFTFNGSFTDAKKAVLKWAEAEADAYNTEIEIS